MFSHNLNVLINNNVNNKIYKLILNLSVREGHTRCLANPPQLVITLSVQGSRLMVHGYETNPLACYHTNYGNKKDVGESFSALIPAFRPSHCPNIRISN
jgi:hypothetical protein